MNVRNQDNLINMNTGAKEIVLNIKYRKYHFYISRKCNVGK